jgi:hypothetical protein
MAVQNLSYANWLNQNENEQNLMQAAGQQPAQAQPVVQPAVEQVQPAVQQQPAQAEQSNPQDMYNKIGQMISSHGSPPPQASPLRPSAFSNQPVSDAPNATRNAPEHGKAGKIMQIIGSIFSMGATKGMSVAQKNSEPKG